MFSFLPAIFMAALLWWMWPWRSVTIFSFYYNDSILKGSTATIRIRRFNRKWEQRTVFGSCTVWHHAETGERQPTYIERLLAARWALEDHRSRS